MKKIACGLLLLGLVATGPATAFERVDTILVDQRLRGYRSPAAAIDRLQAADDVPSDNAPLDLRRRYYGQLADLSVAAGKPALTLTALAKLTAMAERENCRSCRAEMLLARTHAALVRRQTQEALGYLAQARPLVGTDDPQLQLKLGYAEASMQDGLGNLTAAIGYAVPALKLAEQLGNTADRIQLMILMVGFNADLGYTDRALALTEEAVALAEPIGFTDAMGLLRLNQGHIHSLTGARDKQYRALTAALAIAEGDPGLAEVEVTSRSNLADYYLYQGDYAAALEHAGRAAVLARKIGDAKGLAVALANEGIAMNHLGDIDGGIARLNESIALSEKIGHKGYVSGITDELVKVLEGAGRYREALAAMHKTAALDQEITLQERGKAVMELQTRYDTERKNREIEQLSAENRIKEAELSARTAQQRLWAALALILALAAFWLVRWLSRARKSNRRLATDNRELAKQSVHDPLTGAFNRRHCQTLMAQQEAVLVGRTRDPAYTASIGLILIDIDFFKRVNDTHGHASGDAVLVALCQRLQGLVRQQDAVVRWGGEEFVLVLPGTSVAGLTVLVERVLRAIGETPVMVGDKAIPVTASAGCVAFPFFPRQHWEDALHVADLALYQSKAGGRNRATCLVRLHEDAQIDRVRSDLAAAQAAGDVELRIVLGPVAGVPAPALAEDAAQQQRLLVAESKT